MKLLAAQFHSQLIIPFGILSGHCMEAILKCHLLQRGATLKSTRSLGHNLERAWLAATQVGPPIEGPVPDWLKVLNWGHDRPHPYRYLPDTYGAGCPQPESFMPLIPPILESLRKSCGRLI